MSHLMSLSNLLIGLLGLIVLTHVVQACQFHELPYPIDYAAMAAANNAAHARGHSPQCDKTVIHNVRVFDGEILLPPDVVIIEDGVIVDDPTGAQQFVDAEGGVLLPGLIDGHAHPSNVTHLEDLTRFGVTTTMTMACFNPDLCRSLQGHTGLTDIKLSSAPAAAPGSVHGYITSAVDKTGLLLVNSTEQASSWMQRQVAWNPDYIKLIAEFPGLSTETLDALSSEARKYGKKTVLHAAAKASWQQAIDSHVDYIHHTPSDVSIDESQAMKVLEQRQVSTPTLSIMKASANKDPSRNYTAASETVHLLHCKGVPIIAGTDANLQPGLVAEVPFGISMHQEMELLVEAGLSNVEALRAATYTPAMIWGLEDRGVIALGKRADLLLVDGDPIQDIKATRNIKKIWVNGLEFTEPLGTF